jgi:hypothetical protein
VLGAAVLCATSGSKRRLFPCKHLTWAFLGSIVESLLVNDVPYSLRHLLRSITDAVSGFLRCLPQPVLTFIGFLCFGFFSMSTAGLLIYFMPMMPVWQAAVAYLFWVASVGTVLIHYPH